LPGVQRVARRSGDDPEKIAAALGRIVNGFIGLTSALVDNLAESTGSTSEEVLAVLRRVTGQNIAASTV
jgi:hypothetical protein